MPYRLEITNLALTVANYPFDFALRIRQKQSGKQFNGPLIEAQSFNCQNQFPWVFQVDQKQLVIQLIQKPQKKPEIIRSTVIIEELIASQAYQEQILKNRAGKIICALEYLVSDMNDHYEDNNSPNRINENQEREFNDKNLQQNLHPEDMKKISYEIKRLNASVDKILDQTQSDQKKFMQFFNNSSNLLQSLRREQKMIDRKQRKKERERQLQRERQKEKEMQIQLEKQRGERQKRQQQQKQEEQKQKVRNKTGMKIIQSKQRAEIFLSSEKSLEEQSQIQNRWYHQRFLRQLKDSSYSKLTFPQPQPWGYQKIMHQFCLILKYLSKQIQSTSNLLVSQVTLYTLVKINKIIFEKPHSPAKSLVGDLVPIAILECEQGYPYIWNKTILLPFNEVICIRAENENQGEYIFACIGKIEIQRQWVFLFSANGDPCGILFIKCKLLSDYCLQAAQIKQQYTSSAKKYSQNNPSEKVEESAKQLNSSLNQSKISNVWNNLQDIDKKSVSSNLINQRQSKSFDINFQKLQKPNQIDFQENSSDDKKQSYNFKRAKNKQDYKIPLQFSHHLTDNRGSYLPVERGSYFPDKKASKNLYQKNIKFNTVSVKMSKKRSTFTKSFLKVQVKDRQTLITEPLSSNFHLIWELKGFILEDVSSDSQLTIDLYTIKKEINYYEGAAKILFAMLEFKEINKICFYHQFLKDEQSNQIGQIIIGYESFIHQPKKYRAITEKNTSATNHPKMKIGKKKDMYPLNLNYVAASKQKKYLSHMKIDFSGSNVKQILGKRKSLLPKAKKKIAGNVVIGKASRFINEKHQQNPGPNSYFL